MTESGRLLTVGDAPQVGRGGSTKEFAPVTIPGAPKIRKVVPGTGSAAVLTETEGHMYSWGSYYKTGHGKTSNTNKPELVTALRGIKVVDAAMTESLTLVASSEGRMYTFGSSMVGAENHSSNENKKPVRVKLKGYHVLAVAAASGAFACLAVPRTKGEWGGCACCVVCVLCSPCMCGDRRRRR